ncbi:hypothetical protein [Sphaerisporangium sp. NPDC051011]|uniref:hypothetical protein n=1 Tax=Sphaerisporangium sp. NPDC051011 TaxID=3155792 RepID=UPI0033D7EC3E
MAEIDRAQRAAVLRQAKEIRLACQRRGLGVEETCAAIRVEFPAMSRLEAWRLAYGWSRAQAIDGIAALYADAGMERPPLTPGKLCKWEHGEESPRSYVPDLCRLYGVPAAQLGLGEPKRRTPTSRTQLHVDTVSSDAAHIEREPVRRRELMTITGLVIPLAVLRRVDDALAAPPAPQRPETPQQVRVRLQQAHHLYDHSALSALMAGFPALIASAREMADRADTPAGHALLSECYALMVHTFNKVGHRKAARLAAERALLIAERSGDAVAIGAASRPMGMLLRKEQRFDPAARVVERAIAGLEATGLRTSPQASTYIRLQCALAYTTGWARKEQEALDRISEVERIANRLSPLAGPVTSLPFVQLYRSNIHYALGDAEQALYVTEGLRPQMFPTPERRARFHVDVARSAWAAGRPEQTARALLGALSDAPGEVLERPGNQRIASDLVTRHPRVAGVRELATAIGTSPAG